MFREEKEYTKLESLMEGEGKIRKIRKGMNMIDNVQRKKM